MPIDLLDTCLKVVYVLISAFIVLLSIIPYHEKLMNLMPFYRRCTNALKRMRELKEERIYDGRKVKVGYICESDEGFHDLINVLRKRGVIHGINVKELGLMFGDIPLRTTMVGPNAMVYALVTEGGKKVLDVLVFHPFAPELTLSLREIYEHVVSETQRRVALYVTALVIMWSTLSVLFILIK